MKLVKSFKSNLQSDQGYTLVELLCTIVILVLVTSCLIVGVNLCASTYTRSVRYSQAQTLASTLSALISDELRYAKNIEPDNGELTSYKSITQGSGAKIFAAADGKVYIVYKDHPEGACILGQSSYPEGYKVADLSIVYNSEAELFTVTYKITRDSDSSTVKDVRFQVKPLNP